MINSWMNMWLKKYLAIELGMLFKKYYVYYAKGRNLRLGQTNRIGEDRDAIDIFPGFQHHSCSTSAQSVFKLFS